MCETECFQLIFATGSDCLLLPFCQRWWFKFDHDSFNVTVHHSNLTIKIFWFGCIHWYLLCWILFGFSSFLYFFHFFLSFFRFFSSFQFVSFFPTFFLFWKPLFTACFKNQINLHETLCRKRTCLFTIYFHFLWWLNMRAHQN